MPQGSKHPCTRLADAAKTLGRPFWDSSWSPYRRLKAVSDTRCNSREGAMTLPKTVEWMQGAVHALREGCLPILEKAGSKLHWLYGLNLHQLQQELRCLDLIWKPNVRCQIFVILVSRASPLVSTEPGHIALKWRKAQQQRAVQAPVTEVLFSSEDTEKPQEHTQSSRTMCTMKKRWVTRTQRLKSPDQKSCSGEGRNSCCQATIIIQPPCTFLL